MGEFLKYAANRGSWVVCISNDSEVWKFCILDVGNFKIKKTFYHYLSFSNLKAVCYWNCIYFIMIWRGLTASSVYRWNFIENRGLILSAISQVNINLIIFFKESLLLFNASARSFHKYDIAIGIYQKYQFTHQPCSHLISFLQEILGFMQ
ncbi:unnamed protein product [Blepharisma stoltei]|uniref:Uncharacterized protein n=1 Tax=Blepharisma stoltei TaxID=1481888 RepID=A0AAU9K3G5_9CILI|nr:unnamed protein product [Blepharisma stoltei]